MCRKYPLDVNSVLRPVFDGEVSGRVRTDALGHSVTVGTGRSGTARNDVDIPVRQALPVDTGMTL
jgi:hypothetical protein